MMVIYLRLFSRRYVPNGYYPGGILTGYLPGLRFSFAVGGGGGGCNAGF